MARDGGPADYFGKRWVDVAERIRQRDRGICRRCARAWTFEDGARFPVDHIVPRRLFDSIEDANQDGNLVTLCPPCHGYKTARAERLALRGDRHDMTGYLRALGLPSVADDEGGVSRGTVVR